MHTREPKKRKRTLVFWLAVGFALVALVSAIAIVVVLRGTTSIKPERARCEESTAQDERFRANGARDPECIETDPKIAVDQFGYPPGLSKYAVLVEPVNGWNAATHDGRPSAHLEVRRWRDGSLVFSGDAAVWNHGAVDLIAGDRGAWFDFTSVTESGSFFVYDPARNRRSDRFEIGAQVYARVLEAAVRMFYFNRANVAKRAPSACVGDECWTIGESYLGAGQDREAHEIGNANAPARDLSGGWWDAGDVNKYVTFAASAVHQLLSAYSERPRVFGDATRIPESGNGVPDVVDELKVELEWLTKMQPADLDGGVLLKVGNAKHGDPAPDQSRFPRFFYPGFCSSATIAASGMFAHAALIFRDFPQFSALADDFGNRAERAFAHFDAHPKSENCDDGRVLSGDADRTLVQQEQLAVVAAIYLFALKGSPEYGAYVVDHVAGSRPFKESNWSAYEPEQGDALLFYTKLPNADQKTKAAIVERKLSQIGDVQVYGSEPVLDLYRGYLPKGSYHWGSNMARANFGNTNYDLVQYELVPPERRAPFIDRAAGIVHYLNGLNPMQLVYLSNMRAYGAERSASEILHVWFHDGSDRFDSAKDGLGPAPGYLVGGPNAHYCEDVGPDPARCKTSSLKRQPPGKAYLDFNTGWAPEQEHDRSWEISEPSISYQAACVKLLSKFVDPD